MKNRSLGLAGILSIGLGGIVGGGIFATLGLAGAEARGATPLAFLIGGLTALLTAASYVKLSLAYPSKGGTVEFMNRAFGRGLLAGGLNTLLILNYVILIAVYAAAFATYGSALFPAQGHDFWFRVLANGVLILLAVVNFAGPGLVDRSEGLFNVAKFGILGFFALAGLLAPGLDLGRLAPDQWVAPVDVVAGGMLVFISYEGFELIANASDRAANPERALPLAYFGSILTALVFYVLIIAAAFGHMSFEALSQARDYSLAAAAREFLGQPGFVLLCLGAVLATASAINADFFGASKLPVMMAEEGEFPHRYDREAWGRHPFGLVLVAVLSLACVNLMDLGALSAAASAGFLLVFAMVNAACFKLAGKIGASRLVSGAGALACLGALAVMLYQMGARRQRGDEVVVILGMIALPFLYQCLYRRVKARVLAKKGLPGPRPSDLEG